MKWSVSPSSVDKRDEKVDERAANEPAVSFRVTKMVRDVRLPLTMKRRPQVKGVLLALADRCNDDGRNAWPAVPTIAAEVEIGEKMAARCLADLVAAGIIREQDRPRQHRPRTWLLDLDALTRLAGQPAPPPGAELVDAHVVASAPHSEGSAPPFQSPAPHFCDSAPPPGADDPVLLNRPTNSPLNGHEVPDHRTGVTSAIRACTDAHVSPQTLKRVDDGVLAPLAGEIVRRQRGAAWTAQFSELEIVVHQQGLAADHNQLRRVLHAVRPPVRTRHARGHSA